MMDELAREETGDLLGVTGQKIKTSGSDEQVTAYRIGDGLVVSRAALEAYVARAGASLDLEEVSDEEAAVLVAEGRRRS